MSPPLLHVWIAVVSIIIMAGSGSDAALSTNMATTSSVFGKVPEGKPDAILGINESFKSCASSSKVNICVGAYRDGNGKPWILPSVRRAEQLMLLDDDCNKEYASIGGDATFVRLALEFAYGKEVDLSLVAGVQSLSGTGACRVGGHFLSKFVGTDIYLPSPTWGNHIPIFRECGLTVHRYRYYDYATNALDFDGMTQDLRCAKDGSIVLFHACAHNPTGCDPTSDQWMALSHLMKQKKHFVFFDSAYQGFASGNSESDASALRLFVQQGHNVGLAQSFAKNFGLYGERCGTLSFLTNSLEEKEKTLSQLKLIIRPMYSSPPIHGSTIVKIVLQNPELRQQYYTECESMANRIRTMRELLVKKLQEAGSTHDWSHVLHQIGMFAFTGMTSEMCDRLTFEFFIFLTRDGRVSLAGLNEGNVEYVANAVHTVTDGKSITAVSM